jgi:hypothetical protein
LRIWELFLAFQKGTLTITDLASEIALAQFRKLGFPGLYTVFLDIYLGNHF